MFGLWAHDSWWVCCRVLRDVSVDKLCPVNYPGSPAGGVAARYTGMSSPMSLKVNNELGQYPVKDGSNEMQTAGTVAFLAS